MKRLLKRIFTFCLSALLFAMPCAGAFTVSAAANEPLKKRPTYYTDEKMANFKENLEKYPWVASSVAGTTARADFFLTTYSLEELWESIPSQQIYRSYGVNQTYGCLNCGNEIDAYGNYPYTFDYTNDPWKITCPNCKMRFPTNDFKAYYESGLNSKGEFIRSKADKSLLVNTLYPEKGEKWGVDDGTSYVHTNGRKYFFIAYYCHWAQWYSSGMITNAIVNLSNAYLYTGEQKYADAAIVMLNRIGDLYPSFNIDDCQWSEGYRHSGGTKGKIIGSIWETGLIRNFLMAYEALFRGFPTMGKEALDLLKSKNSKISSYKDVMINIENGLFKEVYPTVKEGNIRGNNGMHQSTLTAAAVILDDPVLSKEWLDYVFRAGGGNVSATFVDDVDRDGWGNEASPGYNSGWLGSYMNVADLLHGYKINGTDLSYDLYENVKFKRMFTSAVEIMATPSFGPNIGDTGTTGSAGVVASNSYLIRAYTVYGEPKYAQMIHFLSKGNVDGIRLTMFDKDPESLPAKIKADVEAHGEYVLDSRLLSGFGLATLMNINSAVETSSNDEKYSEFSKDNFTIINAKTNTKAVRDGDKVVFTPTAAGDSLSLGFDLKNTNAIYELLVYSLGAENAGEYNVFIDGKLLQADVDFNTKAGKRESVYFRRTMEITTGYHVLTFQAAEKVGPLAIDGFKLLKTTSAVTTDFHNERTSMTMYFGRNQGHGHWDTLNLELFAFDTNLSPELGYPEFCDGTPNQVYWVENTLSHNTVFINDNHMSGQIVSHPKAFDSSELVSLISVDAKKVYPNASKYQRTSALIKYDNEYSYVIDFFAVEGGKKHTYSFHSADSLDPVTTGLEFTPQVNDKGEYVGTLLGKNIEWGAVGSVTGYQYLDKIRRDEDPDSQISFDWTITETRYTKARDIHLKFTMLNELNEVVLANGTPPRNKAGNPKGLDYVLASRTAAKGELSSLFVSVIEPYISDSFITSTEFVPVTTANGEVNDDSIKAVKVTFANGRVDYVVYSEEPNATYTIDKKFYFKGFFGVCSIRDGKNVFYTNDAVMDTVEKQTRYTGVVQNFTKELTMDNYIYVKFDSEIDIANVLDKYIYIKDDGVRNAVYHIKGVEKQDDGSYALFIGDTTLIRSYKSAAKPELGFTYDVAANRTFYIPISETSGDVAALTEGTKATVSDIILSNNIKADAKPGDKVGKLFVVDTKIDYLYQMPSYKLTIGESADADKFEIKDGWLCLSDKYVADKKDFDVTVIAEDTATGEKKSVVINVNVLSKSQSNSQIYPEFALSETEDTAEIVAASQPQQPDGPADNEKTASSINWLLIAIVTAVCAAVLGITAILTKKKA